MMFILQKIFTQVLVASDGKEGFELFKKNQIDVILTDIEMPKLNGIEMIHNIRAMDKDIPIVVLSAYSKTYYLTESIKHQVQAYLFKPINRKQFLDTFQKVHESYMERKRQKSRLELLEDYKGLTDDSCIILKIDTLGKIIYVNNQCCETYDYRQDELIGKSYELIQASQEMRKKIDLLRKFVIQKKKVWKGVLKSRTKSGKMCYTQTTIKPIFDFKGEVETLMISKMLITDFIHPEKQLKDILLTMDESAVVILKIEDFKHLENTLESEVSEEIQKKFLKKLFEFKALSSYMNKVYFLGDGQFVFVKEMFQSEKLQNKKSYTNKFISRLIKNLKLFQMEVNHAKINIKPIDYDLSIVVSLSYGKNTLENAKLGLSSLEKSKKDCNHSAPTNPKSS